MHELAQSNQAPRLIPDSASFSFF